MTTDVFLTMPVCETRADVDKIDAYIDRLGSRYYNALNHPFLARYDKPLVADARVRRWLRCISRAECVARVPGWEDNPESQLWDYIARYLNIPEVHLENGQLVIEAEATRPTEYGEA